MMKKNQHLFNRCTQGVKPLILFVLCVLGCTTNPVFAQNWDEIIKKVASDRGAHDLFGSSVAISGDYAVVGAIHEGDDSIGGGEFITQSGAVYIFKNYAGTWSEVQKILASDRSTSAAFGNSVAISGDYLIVGASNEEHDTIGGAFLERAGAAYIFKNDEGIWTEVQKIVASDRGAIDYFGTSVTISGDYAIVGASHEDHDTSGGTFIDRAGAAYIFKNEAGTWFEAQKIVASDRGLHNQFGRSVAILGDCALIGALGADYDTSGGAFLISAGAAYIFKRDAGIWFETQKLVASDRGENDFFGLSVAISEDHAIVGAPGEDHDTSGGAYLNSAGAAYIFKNIAGTWSEELKIVASDRGALDEFGLSVAISGDYALVGAENEDHDTTGATYLSNSGSAYMFKNIAGTWSDVHKIVASDRWTGDFFGESVSISGDYAIVGAKSEDHDTTGGAYLNSAGSAYIFKKSCATSGTDVQTACDSFTWIDGNIYVISNNTATFILTNVAGCDSIVTLDLTINNDHTTDVQTACDTYTWMDGITYLVSNNTATYTLTNVAGCDSIVTLDLTINSGSYLTTDVQTACDTYTWMDGITYIVSNDTATYILTNMAGCDSVVTLDLTIIGVSDITTALDGLTISANNASATYQWLDCNNSFAEILGETNQDYTLPKMEAMR
jgi:hypothetical protein